MKHIRILVVVLLLMAALMQVRTANASATVESYSAGCSSFSAVGTTTAPYVSIEVDNDGDTIAYQTYAVSDGKFSISVSFEEEDEDTELEYYVWGSVSSGGKWDTEDYLYLDQECGVSDGPSIPDDFVLKTITCDVGLFDEPDGEPISGASIKAGQTWYVNPEPEEDEDGEEWTEIFVSSDLNPYIPTSCVGG